MLTPSAPFRSRSVTRIDYGPLRSEGFEIASSPDLKEVTTLARRTLDPTSSPLAALAVQISRSRQAMGLTQIELGKLVGYSNAYISNVEGAKQPPSLRFVELVDEALEAGGSILLLYWSWKGGSLIPGFPEYATKEREAIGIRFFATGLVPGVLQHPDYSAAYEAAIVRRGDATRDQADERLRLLDE
ncbi:Scr1 family TA system antitoxin-like transcriptional regulator [Kitasatospora sp. NPDC056783]|uniref:Scr1 family TA system antitoxin-like transcriptional regulator n=1 Tax=Kitasatospora sp. NPDC056783 TaxID=3345943 RepID=UPI0036B25350